MALEIQIQGWYFELMFDSQNPKCTHFERFLGNAVMTRMLREMEKVTR
jgi:hypothetical protein